MNPLEPYVPDDFDAFWTEAVAEAERAPLDYRRHPQSDVAGASGTVDLLTFRSITGDTLHGWFAYPDDGPSPAFLWVPPYSRWSMMPNQYGTRPGMCSLSFNFFGESAFHQETYTPARGYFADGLFEPETWVFRRMFQDAVIATRVLEAQIEVDESRIASSGMSQGAGISIWLGAWCQRIKAVAGDMPFLGGMPWVFDQPIRRYPLKELTDAIEQAPLGRERALMTLSYFDTMNQATRCAVPTLLTAGLKDPAVRPEQVRAIFQALAAEKKELVELDWGHDWHPTMIERNHNWMLRALK